MTAHRSHCRESEPTASHPHEPLQVPQIAALVQIEVVTAREAMAYPYDQSVRGSLASKTFRVATKQPRRVSPDPRTREARVLYRSPEAEASNGIMSSGRSSGSRLDRNVDTFPFSIHRKRIKISGLSGFSPNTAAVLRRIRTDFPFHLQANGGT